VSPPLATARPPAALRETAAEAIHTLDTQFPWLSGAEKQIPRKPERGVRARRGPSRVD